MGPGSVLRRLSSRRGRDKTLLEEGTREAVLPGKEKRKELSGRPIVSWKLFLSV